MKCLQLKNYISPIVRIRSMKNRRTAIYNGKRTEWSPIRSVIIRVINEIGRPHSGSPICLIMSMITDRIGRHEVLLPINHIYNKISKRKGRKRTGEGIDNSFMIRKKNVFKCNWPISARALTRTVQLLRHDQNPTRRLAHKAPRFSAIVANTILESSDKKFTNHSARKTVVSKLKKANVERSGIVKVT